MRAQRLLSNAGTFTFAVPQERSGRASPALTRATRQFQASRGLAVDGRITKSGETLRGLDTTLFAANGPKDPPKEEFPEEPPEVEDPKEPPKKPGDPKEPPKDEKPKDPEKDKEDEKREICAALGRDLDNISEQQDQVLKQIVAANKDFVRKNRELTALMEKRGESIASTVGSGIAGAFTGGPLGAARGVVAKALDLSNKESKIRQKTEEVEDALRRLRNNREDLEELQRESRELVKKYKDAGCGGE